MLKNIVMALWLLIYSHAGNAGQVNELTEKIDHHLQQYVKTEGFRGAVLVARAGKTLFKAAYGNADDSKNIANTTDKKFLIGSLTKSFIAVTVMTLVEEGKLALHAPLVNYIPQLKKSLAKDLTLHLLLKHQSGLVPHLERIVDFEEKDISPAEILTIINSSELAFKPASQYQYANLNYHLAAIAIENVTGKSYGQVLQEKIFSPLKMSNSGVERLSYIPKNRAKGYRKGFFGVNRDENIVSYALGSGDIYSTVDDLFAREQALYGTQLLSEKANSSFFHRQVKPMAIMVMAFELKSISGLTASKIKGH
ncbi:serine hydrolase domain-containing protein [Thalassomonas actiniarum]|uniref:Beta-lactamase family protein n=1 Tax=Thalassomonas actiniarum TaxID=485447 RepID=A0AAF0C5A7_9GAMM|nr:serine hydrolase domain-containing protein [Thalassomonas actiniarum]WDE01333.1 beta-lactamase family protein [Thalassomonas actiniarum]